MLAALYAAATGRPAPSLEEVRAEIAAFDPRYAPITGVGSQGGFWWNHPVARAQLIYTAEPPNTSPRQGVSFSTIDAFFEHESRRLLTSPA